MEHRNGIRSVALTLFSVLFLLSAYMVFSYFGESYVQEKAFDELEALVAAAETAPSPIPSPDTATEESPFPAMLPGYAALYEKNPDLFGWVQIEGTTLDYPVMHTPDDPEHYLRRAFDGTNSQSGVPFLDGACFEGCGNYLVYGHNMRGGTMFATLLSYAEEDFWRQHPVIRFDTLYESGSYEVLAAFYAEVYEKSESGGFRYYQFTDLRDEEVFEAYIERTKQNALYDTGVEVQYGDHLLTLSTCSYHADEGRFVVVARKEEG